MEKQRIYAGKLSRDEYESWKTAMIKDGFDKFWTWIIWVIRNHIKKGESQ